MDRAAAIRAGALACWLSGAALAQQPAHMSGRYERTLANLAEPVAAAFDPDGRLYIVLRAGHCVQVVEANGSTRTLGRPGHGDGELWRPTGVALGRDGAVLVVDSGNHRVAVFEPGGKILANWGRRGRDPGQFCDPSAIARDAEHVYVIDAGNARVQVFDHAGRPLSCIALPAGSDCAGAAVDGEGRLLVTDAISHRVLCFGSDGAAREGWGDWGSNRGLLAAPRGLACSGDETYVAEEFNHRIQVFSRAGNPQYEWGLHVLRPHEGEGHIHYPLGVAVSPDGAQVAVCEPREDRVQIFGRLPAGERPPERLIQGPAPAAHFGERLDASGAYLAIIEPENQSVQVYDASRGTALNISTIGTYGAKPGQLRSPRDVALDAARGELLVLDAGNRRVQQFHVSFNPQADVAFSLRMHRLVRCVSYEALSGQLADRLEWSLDPVAIALDGRGRKYLLDARNARVLVLDAEWRCHASWGMQGEHAARFQRAVDLALSPDGTRVYVLDADRRCVQVFDADGHYQARWPLNGAKPPAASDPYGIAATRAAVYVVDRGLDEVLRLDLRGQPAGRWGKRGLAAAEFFKPTTPAVDALGRLLVLDHGNHRGQFFTQDGGFLHAFGARLFVLPTRAATRPAASAPGDATTQNASGGAGRAGGLPPGLDLEAYPFRGWSNGGSYFVALRPGPAPIPMNEPFELDVLVRAGDDWTGALEDAVVTVDADMPEHLHGMNTRPRVQVGAGGLLHVEGMLLHMPGYWEIYVDITRGGVTERAQFGLTLE